VYVVCATVGESIANSSKWSANHCITVSAAAEKTRKSWKARNAPQIL